MSRLFGAHLPKLVFLLAFLPGLAVAYVLYSGAERRAASEFTRVADQAIDRIVTRVEQHVIVLRAARGLMSATRGGISRADFQSFLASVDIVTELTGVQGIGFARLIASDDTASAQADIRRNYGLDLTVRPATDQPWRTPIVLLEPENDRNRAALGFDMYSEATRRSTMDRAIASGEAQMTGPVELVQEITNDKQTGFLIYLPFQNTTPPAETADGLPVGGFVYAPFRGGDLIRAALASGPPLPVVLRVVDTGDSEIPLFDTLADAGPSPIPYLRTQAILGRQWSFEVLSAALGGFGPAHHLNSLLLLTVSFLFAAAAAYGVAARQNEALQARALAAAAAREAEYRELLLQEMKHRIKNHIARIQSIARQSARGATDVKAFSAAFDARLQAMAAAQEILAGTALAQADLRAILVKELQQSLDATEVDHLVEGPTVRLDERQAHSFALVVHELVTNAMKYGGLSPVGHGIHISWTVTTGNGVPRVDLRWHERMPATEPRSTGGSGFGSRLIEASLKGELNGKLSRDYRPDGLVIDISFPLDPGLNRTPN